VASHQDRDAQGAPAQAGPLTLREAQVFELMKEGLENKQIAEKLCVSVHTVKNHVHRILAKEGLKRRWEARPTRISVHRESTSGQPTSTGAVQVR